MKLIELVVDELAEMLGFDGNSLVGSPAHEESFYAFKEENVEDLIVSELIKNEVLSQIMFVSKLPGETESDYVSRCIPVLKSEGYDLDQATAICYESFGLDINGLPNYANEPTGSVIDKPASFAFASEDQQIVIGPLMVPHKKIFRIDDMTGEPYEVFFSEETVRIIGEGMMRDKMLDRLNMEHDPNQPVQGYMMSSWFVEDPKMDTSRAYGLKEYPKGTWMGMYRILDKDVWKKVKSGELTGFSIEGYFADKLIKN